MTTIVLVALAMGILGFCIYYWVPMGDPGKCRIIRRNGKETGKVRNTGGFVLPFNGWLQDFVETDKRFTVDVPSFEVGFPNEDTATTSLSLLFEIADDGGEKFVKNGQKDGISAKVARVGKSTIDRFAQARDQEPTSANQAQKMYREFVLRVADAFTSENLCERATNAPDRERFLEDLVVLLAENDGCLSVPQFGLRLVGLSMTQFAEPKVVTDAAAEKKAAVIKNEKELAEIEAITEQRKKLVEGFEGQVNFKDADLALQVWKQKTPRAVEERIIRIEGDDKSGSVDKLAGTFIAAMMEQNKGTGGKKK